MPDITVSLGGSNAQLSAILQDTVKKLSGLKSSVASALGPLQAIFPEIAAAAGLGAGFAGIAEQIGSVIGKGKELSELMTQTGASGANLLQIQKAFKAAGMEAEGVGPAIGRLQKALAGVNEDGEGTSGVFGQLGIDINRLKGLNSAQQFAVIGKAIRGLQDPAQKTEAVMKIFGKSGAEMLRLLNSAQASDALTAGLSRSQQLLATNANMYASISKKVQGFMSQLKGSFGLFSGLAAGIAPALDNLLNKLPKVDLSGIGEQIGHAAALLIQAFSDGKLGQLVGLSLQVGFMKAGNALFSILQGIGGAMSAIGGPLVAYYKLAAMEYINFMSSGVNGIGRAMGAFLAYYAQTLSAAFSNLPTYLGSLKDGLIGAIQVAGSYLMEIFQKPIIAFQTGLEFAVQSMMEKLSKMPGVGKLLGLKDFKAESHDDIAKRRESEGAKFGGSTAADMRASGEAKINKAGAGLKDTFKDVDFKGGAAEIGDQFKEGFKNGGLFDKKQLDATKAQIDPSTLLSKVSQGYKDGQSGGAGPFDASESEGKLGALTNQLSAGLSDTAKKYNTPKAAGTNSLDTTGKTDKDAKDKDAKLPADKDPKEAEKKGLEAAGSNANRATSSLAKLGGGGYAAGGGLMGIMQKSAQAQQKLVELTQKLVEGSKGNDKKQPLQHLTAGATGNSGATVG